MSKISKNQKVYAWACDITNFRGEGILARHFLSELNKKNQIYINNFFFFKLKFKKINIWHNYLYPFLGVITIWYHHFCKRKTIYLNYLPLWNFLLFLLLPSKTILGPITGGAVFQNQKTINFFIRKYLFPFFYYLSVKIISLKFNGALFSTSLLKKYCKKKNNFIFDYSVSIYNKRKYKKKKYDLIFYFRKNKNKNNLHQIKLLKKLVNLKIKILVIGDNPGIKNLNYLGNLDRSKTFKYIKICRYAVNNSENLMSIFSIDCLSCGTRVIHFSKSKEKICYFNSDIIIQKKFINLDDQILKILKILSSKYNKKFQFNNKKLNQKKIEFKKYFLKYY